ncbi:MAG: ACP S-malonyltransferase [Gemmataceae bacterium]
MLRTAFLFPGQGAQSVGMAGELYRSLPAAKDLFDRASQILGYDLISICVGGPAERLNATDVSQPAIFVANLAALESLKQTEPEAISSVVATAGLSLGEYSALVFAGAMSFEEGLKVVKARGEAMQAAALATPSGMVSILGLEVPEVESIVADAKSAGTLEVANRLCPGNTVVSGTNAAIDKVEEICTSRGGIRTIRLAVAGAFHTNLMKPADTALDHALAGVSLKAPSVPVWSNVDAKPHTDPADFRSLLVKQILSPVLWEETMRGMIEAGVERFYEIGPGRVLAGLLKRVMRKAEVKNIAAA